MRHGFRSSVKDWTRQHDVDTPLSEFALVYVLGSATVAALHPLRYRAATAPRHYLSSSQNVRLQLWRVARTCAKFGSDGARSASWTLKRRARPGKFSW